MGFTAARLLAELRAHGSAENLAGMARFGIDPAGAYGAPLAVIRPIARRVGRDHALALELWDTGVREARVLAIFIADPARMTSREMDRWAAQIHSWDICDGCAVHLFRKSPLAWEKALAWSRRKPEFVRRLGFAMFATLAVHDKASPDKRFLEVLVLIENSAEKMPKKYEMKGVNWALRQIGKRNPRLCRKAIAVSRRLAESTGPSARWIGKDALRELLKVSASSSTRHS
jgi:3-methyladenine DNA glycosylase AlkD